MGNLRSVEKAVQFLGFECDISPEVGNPDRLIIPGVGAFGAAMERLADKVSGIRDFVQTGKPLLGICLGQQLLFDGSDEHGKHEGLGLIPGWVKYFPPDMNLKVPHIGWNKLDYSPNSWLHSNHCDEVYFVHSLYTECRDVTDIAATCHYGLEFAAAVQRENVFGTQFHPEKSSTVGLRILRKFLEC